ncbi:CHAP domain-containing protein [Candidatus Saccharibacteria bacterium]|nr:CHAP domain-containing protein [Candidatus Saccharibacteria bacterium]
MVILKRVKLIALSLVLIVASCFLITKTQSTTVFAVDYCVTDECRAAAEAEARAREAARQAAAAAETLEQVVQGLELEIYALEAKIRSNEAVAADLALHIQENTDKLNVQKAALASLLVDNYFEAEPDTIMLLAGSNSISDISEKQARAETIKQQINLSAKNIKAVKLELEEQKAEVDRILVDQNNQKQVIAEKRAEQNRLIAEYQQNAAAFSAEAEEARLVKEKEIAEEIARLNSQGVAAFGINTYPYQHDCPHKNLWYSTQWGYVCQCTSYAGYKAYEHWGVYIAYWGNAYSWDESAVARGYRVDRSPAPYTIAVSNSGAWGHVMWVESVNADGTINLSEYNNSYSAMSHLPGDYGYRSGVSTAGLVFIHFD